METKYRPYKARLQIITLIHPQSPDLPLYPKLIYSVLNRDIKNPLSRGLGIPVFCWNSIDKLIETFDTNSAHYTVFIILIDYKMVNDSPWGEFLADLWIKIKDKKQYRFIPVALDETAINIHKTIESIEFIKLYTIPENNRTDYLQIQIFHELCKILRQDLNPIFLKNPPSPIKLFLSHANIDGEPFILKVKDYIHKNTPLDSFFDIINISPGYEFGKIIDQNLINSCILVFQTDEFAKREWCRYEVLTAKEKNCPIIIINCLKNGEDRSFPYMGNVPVICWSNQDDNKIIVILLLALKETLRNFYNILHLKDISNLWFSGEKNIPCYSAPEILTCLQLLNKIQKQKFKKIIYPDPPLGIEELTLLKKSIPRMKFMTPTQFIEGNLEAQSDSQKIIGISISESPDLPRNGLTQHHLKDALIEFTRYFLATSVIIAYGGDLRKDGFTYILFDLMRNHTKSDKEPYRRIINYLSWPFYKDLDEKEQANLNKIAEIRKIGLPEDLKQFSDIEIDKAKPNIKYFIARTLTKMRYKMNKDIACRIFLGGSKSKFLGTYPGLVEEAYLALKMKKPVYLIGAFGGATYEIIEALLGNTPDILTTSHHISKNEYKLFFDYYNEQVSKIDSIKESVINFEEILNFFHSIGVNGLNNGLNKSENMQLFKTLYISEMILLVMKGLSKLQIIK